VEPAAVLFFHDPFRYTRDELQGFQDGNPSESSVMSSAFPPEPRDTGPAKKATAPSDDSYVSEFLSEDSPELDAAWPAGAEPPPQAEASTAPSDAVSPVIREAPAGLPAAAPVVVPAATAPVVAPVATAPVVAAVAPPPTIVRPTGTGRGFWRWLMMTVGVAAVVVTGAWFVQERRVPDATGTTPPPVTEGTVTKGTVAEETVTEGAVARVAEDAVATVAEGTATIMSRPEGAEVFIDGERRGITPLRLSLPVGNYAMELRNGAAIRSLTLTIEAGTAVRETVDLDPSAALGRLEVRTDVAGARVSVDGIPRGVTPLVVSGLTPGQHRVTLSRGDATVYRTATVRAGTTATLVAFLVPPRSSNGWLTFQSPIEAQVMKNGRLLGTTRSGPIMVPAGLHDLQLVAEPYGFRTTATAVVAAGEKVNIPVTIPEGRLSITAVPWADVWLDGRSLGRTPLANVAVPIGDHDIVWRHPDLGERRQSVRVTATTPARASMDLGR
jgi:hypothetical protein